MGMSIDKSKRILIDRYIDTYVVCGGANYNPTINITREDYEAFQVAISTMRKYQKIERILDYWINEDAVGMSDYWIGRIKQVIEEREQNNE